MSLPVNPWPSEWRAGSTAFGVVETIAEVMLTRGVPEHIRSDNGSEMTAKVARTWLTQVGVKTLFIELGSPSVAETREDQKRHYHRRLRHQWKVA